MIGGDRIKLWIGSGDAVLYSAEVVAPSVVI
jgi:hypothetical protein